MSRRNVAVVVALVVAVAVVALGVARWQDEDGPGSSGPGLSRVSAEQARDLVDDGAVLVDVRSPEEYAEGHLEGARNVPVEADGFDDRIDPLDRDATYVVYCASGRRAALAIARMRDLGFTDLHNAGGLDDVADVVAPVTEAL